MKDIERSFEVLQCMWLIISITLHFEKVDSMRVVTKCVIILNNIVVEERVFAAGTDEEELAQDIFVGSAHASIWKGMVPTSGGWSGSGALVMLVGRRALKTFKERTEENDTTKRLPEERIWGAHGEL